MQGEGWGPLQIVAEKILCSRIVFLRFFFHVAGRRTKKNKISQVSHMRHL